MLFPTTSTFETVTVVAGAAVLILSVFALIWWHIRFKHPEKDRFLKVWRHPFCRLSTSLVSLVLNIYSITEDPTIQSWRNIDLGFLSLAVRFLFADWPADQKLRSFKIVLVGCSIIASFAVSIHLIHHRFLRGNLNLEMFEKSRGQTVITAITFLPLVAIWAILYNSFIAVIRRKIDYSDAFPYVGSIIPISYHVFGMITSSVTGIACCVSLVMIIDVMLQDPTQYGNWCKHIRPYWADYRQLISVTFQSAFSVAWLAAIWSGYLTQHLQSKRFEFLRTTETTRCFILGLCGALDICSITQDWEFPSFDNPLELKLVFLDVSRLTICRKRKKTRTRANRGVTGKGLAPETEKSNACTKELVSTNPTYLNTKETFSSLFAPDVNEASPTFLVSSLDVSSTASSSRTTLTTVLNGENWRKASEEFIAFVGLEDVSISGKWFNYGAMIINLYLNISNMSQCIFYDPLDYAQYIEPSSRVLWSICDPVIANSPQSELKARATWAARSDYRSHDVRLHARFIGGPVIIAAIISVAPVVLGLAVFFESLRKYNRHPDDVARRARLRTQNAMKKLKGALRFISLARKKRISISPEGDFSAEEVEHLISDEYGQAYNKDSSVFKIDVSNKASRRLLSDDGKYNKRIDPSSNNCHNRNYSV